MQRPKELGVLGVLAGGGFPGIRVIATGVFLMNRKVVSRLFQRLHRQDAGVDGPAASVALPIRPTIHFNAEPFFVVSWGDFFSGLPAETIFLESNLRPKLRI